MEKEVCLFLLLLGAGLAKPLLAGINDVPFVIEFENGAYHQVCTNSTCIEASHRMFENMDTSADPCDDFFQFACGRFVKNKEIPDDRGGLDVFTPGAEAILLRGRNIMDAEPKEDDFLSDQKARTLYRSCMSTEALENSGLEPIKKLLNDLGGWPVLQDISCNWDTFEWADFTIKSMELGLDVDYIVEHDVDQDSRNTIERVIIFDQPDLGMKRDYLIQGFENKEVQYYYNYMVEAAILLGADKERARLEMKEALLLEIDLANVSTSKELRRDPNSKYHNTTVDNMPIFQKALGKLTVKEYLQKMVDASDNPCIEIQESEKIVIQDLNYFQAFPGVLDVRDKKVIANYLGWRVFKSRVKFLNQAARKLRENYKKSLKGVAKAKSKWKSCLEEMGFNQKPDEDGVHGLVGSMYVRHYFKPEDKKEVEKMIVYLKQAFSSMLQDSDWLDNETKDQAKKKLDTMDQFIGYPEELVNKDIMDEYYSNLEFSEGNYFQNQLNIKKFDNSKIFSRLRQVADPKDWTFHSTVALFNAFYNGEINSMEFPAGILQGIAFNRNAPKYMNYGMIGIVIGHEITHGFDDRGRTRDYKGNLLDWWSEETAENYKKRAQCIIDQYGNYTAGQIGLNLNGINTQGENIADNGGVKESYLAYSNYVKDNGEEPKLPGHPFSPRQLFWLTYAQSTCSKYTDGTLRDKILNKPHSISEFRLKGPLSNNPDFARDFNCPQRSNMNPVSKCSVW